MNGRIVIDPRVCHGQACIKGTRIPVHQLLGMLANGNTCTDLLEDYPSLTQEDILACLAYAASLVEEQMTPLEIMKQGYLATREDRRRLNQAWGAIDAEGWPG